MHDFSYSSRPRPLQARRKYRNEPGQAEGYRNLMFDRRIVRGNTYAREDVLPVTAQVLYSGFPGRPFALLKGPSGGKNRI